jgi:hypothetical protein
MSGAPAHRAAMGDRSPVQRQPRGNAPAVIQGSRSRPGSAATAKSPGVARIGALP